MRYFALDFRPTEEQEDEVAARVIDGAILGEVGVYYLTFDDAQYDRPEWLVGEELPVSSMTSGGA